MQEFLKTNSKLIFLCIFFVAAMLRLYGINWDSGHHLHPDERAIVMFTTPLSFPTSMAEFFSPQSSWNPHFFAYGSFPLYFLKTVGSVMALGNPIYGSYDGINLVGRFLSTFFDLVTLLTLFLLGRKLFNPSVGLLAAFFYGVGVLPIQLSHFYAVDTPLTFFILLTLFLLIKFYEKPTFGIAILVGIFFGLSLATKTSALVLLVSIGVTMVIDFLLIFFRNIHRVQLWLPHVPGQLQKLFTDGVLISITALAIFLIFEPYALIDFAEFWKQNLAQAAMTKNAYTFPYTLQYVGKLPYLYELKNIFFWGLGPVLALLAFVGSLYFTSLAFRKEKKEKWAQELILVVFFWAYFLVVGNFAIGFMRYLLPIYPLLCLFAAVAFFRLLTRIPSYMRVLVVSSYLLAVIIWPLSFLHIYTTQNTRVMATQWINQNIMSGQTLAIEHWDDRVPLVGSDKYQFIEMTLYDQPDDERKWQIMNAKLQQADYIIISSNRLYTPLQKLIDCTKYKSCYPQTVRYYQALFSGSLGFEKVAEFENYPTVPLLNIPIDDQNADESFTVYDHPKVMIFRKSTSR